MLEELHPTVCLHLECRAIEVEGVVCATKLTIPACKIGDMVVVVAETDPLFEPRHNLQVHDLTNPFGDTVSPPGKLDSSGIGAHAEDLSLNTDGKVLANHVQGKPKHIPYDDS